MKNRLLIFCLSFVIAIVPSAHAATESTVKLYESLSKKTFSPEDELYQKCKSAYEKRNSTEANQHIEKFLSTYPESSNITEVFFMQAFLQTDVNISIEMYKAIANKYPKSKFAGKSYFQLGQFYYLQGKYDESAESYRKIVVDYSGDESYWHARYWRCKCLMAKGDYDGAIYFLNSLESSNPKEISKDTILMSLGECHSGKKDYEKAASTYKALIDSMPESQWIPLAYISLAKNLSNLGRTEEAKAIYRKVMESYRQSVEVQQAKQYLDSLSSAPPEQNKPEKVKMNTQLESLLPDIGKKDPPPPVVLPRPASPGEDEVKPLKAKKQPDNLSASIQIKWDNDKETKTEEKPGSDQYFSVQVGAFSTKSSAQNLADQLKKKKYSVDIILPLPGESSMYKVRVGKFKSKNEAMKLAQKLAKEEKLSTGIISPTK